jgi:hypothetical protein
LELSLFPCHRPKGQAVALELESRLRPSRWR